MSGAHSAKRSLVVEPHWNRAWAAFVFGAIAVIALALIAFVLTTQRTPSPAAGPPVLLTEVPSTSTPSPAPQSSAHRIAKRSSAATTTASAPSTPAPMPRTTVASTTSARVVSHPTRPAPRSRPSGPCPGNAACVVAGTGQVPAALSTYRRTHGMGAVPSVVTGAAQQCAVTGGDGASCGNPFAVAREWRQSGWQAIRDIGSGTGNFLLDPALRRVQVGWAYDPPTGQYVCVLIARN